MDRPSDRDAALRNLYALLGSLQGQFTVSVHTQDGASATYLIPPPCHPSQPPPPPRDDGERDCRADILAVLTEAGRRLTTTQILGELERRDWHHGERTVKGHLARMVAAGALDNSPHARPPGYAPVQH
ncbi:MAG: hypothetical protein IT429_26030 [Gemmataceae bacterium]|nr:hypothetical protein [Gemmataceae bacterium]